MNIEMFGATTGLNDIYKDFRTFEIHIASILAKRYNRIDEQKRIAPGHRPDILVWDTKTIVSVKMQKVVGTAEEKIAYEMWKLQRACDNLDWNNAVVIAGGPMITLLDEMKEISKLFKDVEIYRYEDDIELTYI
tara:strand:- start:1477 stop:1878 length:402 start_codon:yes stop_codon:yes gene_type:complete